MLKEWLTIIPVVLTLIINSQSGFLNTQATLLCQNYHFQQQEKKIRCRFGYITVDGAKSFTPAQIKVISKIKSGAIANEETIKRAEEMIRKAYLARGFIHAEISLSQEPTPPISEGENCLVNIVINIKEGASFFIRRVEFTGNIVTKDAVVWRAIGLRPGEPYNPARVELSIVRLNRLGRFERISREDVTITINEQEHFVDLDFQLKEKERD